MTDFVIRIDEGGITKTYQWSLTYEAESGQKVVVLVEVVQ